MKNLIILIFFLLFSCSNFPREGPTIYVSNLSPNIVKNISIKFPQKTLNLTHLSPGATQGSSFIINGSEDFFGIIKVSWKNLYDENIIRNFSIKKNDLPSFLIPKILVMCKFISKITTSKLLLTTPKILATKLLKWISF